MEQTHAPQLRECLVAIAKLTAANVKLHAKLKRAKQRVDSSQRATEAPVRPLRDQSAPTRRHTTREQPASARAAPSATQDEQRDGEVDALRAQLEALTTQLASREHENLALLQSLSERKEQHERAVAEHTEQPAAALEAHRQQVHAVEVEHSAKLTNYMDQVNAKLQRLEADNETLRHAKQQLETDMTALRDATTPSQQQVQSPTQRQRSRIATVSDKATETDAALLLEHDQVAQQDLVMRIRVLELQLTQEQRANETLRDASRKVETEQTHGATSHAAVAQASEAKMREVEARHAQLTQAFSAFQAASDDAARASEKRIAFLVACVDECVRLVDSPSSESVTVQDIHDVVIALSHDAAVAPAPQRQRFAARRRRSDTPTHASKQRSSAKRQVPSIATSVDVRLESSSARFAASRSFDKLLLSEDDSSDQHQQQWRACVATLEQQLRASRLTNETLEDQLRRSESERSDLRDEVRDCLARELALATKANGLKQELAKLKTHAAALAARYDDVRTTLQQQIDERHVATQEVSRVRAAIQRKSELLQQSKARVTELTRELQSAAQRAEALASAEKKTLQQQQRAREQVQTLQDAKRQLEASQAHEYALTVALEREKEQSRNAQMRMKTLRAENTTLRTHVSELKTQQQLERPMNARASIELNSSSSSGQTARQRQSDGPKAPTGLQDEAKMLRKRVLQKQQLVLALRAKATEQEREIAQLHTKVLAAAQLNRELQLDLSTQKENALRHVAAMRTEMSDAVAQRTAHLDGLRASVYDSLEVFMHCRSSNESEARDRASRSTLVARERERSDAPSELDTDALLAMRRWTDLSASDLDALHKQSPGERRRSALEDQKHSKLLLSRVEHALEQRPEDCRSEICEVLEFLCKRERERFVARSY